VAVTAVVVIAGFALGQWFQQDSESPTLSKPIEKDITPTADTSNERRIEDRSTDKITIRAEVTKPVAIPTLAPRIREAANTPMLNDKEMKELKDLKQELQELKALKEELKSNGGSPMMTDEEAAAIPDEDYLTPNTNSDPEGGAAYEPGMGGYDSNPNRGYDANGNPSGASGGGSAPQRSYIIDNPNNNPNSQPTPPVNY
jgi:hypothetical protein